MKASISAAKTRKESELRPYVYIQSYRIVNFFQRCFFPGPIFHQSAKPPRPAGRPPRPEADQASLQPESGRSSSRPGAGFGDSSRPGKTLVAGFGDATRVASLVLTTPAANPTIRRKPTQPTSVVFLDTSGNNLPSIKTESAFPSPGPNLLAPISSGFQTKRPVQSPQKDFPEEAAAVVDEKLVQAKPHLELQAHLIQTQTLRAQEANKELADKQPAEEDRKQTSKSAKPFQVFRKPTVLQGKLVSSSFSPAADVKPKSRPEEARNPTLERENSGLVKQQFTAFRKPPRPSGKPRKTLGPQSVDGDIENNPGSQHNEPEVIRQGGGSTTLPEQINTFFSGEITPVAATRKPKTFSAQTAKPFNRVPVKTRNSGEEGKRIVFKTTQPTSSPGRFKASPGSKRVIFKDSTIAVSPGSVIVPETITLGSLLDDPQPTVQLPFVIEGTGKTGGEPEDVSIPIVILEEEEERGRSRGKIKVMTEIEFENQFGRSTTAPALKPRQQVGETLSLYMFESLNQIMLVM